MKFILLILIFLSSLCSARTFYVDNNGNDSNSGLNPDIAWQTINRVNAYNFSLGDSISFKGGQTFTGTISKTFLNGDKATIVFNSYPSDSKATIKPLNGLQAFNFLSKGDNEFNLTVENFKIIGLYIADSETGGHIWNSGIAVSIPDSMIYNNQSFIKLSNCEISNFGYAGISIENKDVRRNFTFLIENNKINDCGGNGITTHGTWQESSKIIGNTVFNIPGKSEQGFVLAIFSTVTKNLLVSRNVVYNVGMRALWGSVCIGTSGSRHVTISYNETYGAKAQVVDGDGIDFDWNADSCIAEYNYIHNNDGAGVLISGSGTNWINGDYASMYFGEGNFFADESNSDYNIVRYNIFKNNGRKINYGEITFYSENGNYKMKGNKIYNNTFVSTKKTDVESPSIIAVIGTGGTESTMIYNNIFLSDSVVFYNIYGESLDWQAFNNVYWQNGLVDLSLWNSIRESNNISRKQNPLLKNPFTLNDTINNAYLLDTMTSYDLQSNSPLIDEGIGASEDVLD